MSGSEHISSSEKSKEYNIFRDSAVRYFGYANEVGESFRYQFPKFVVPSYILSFGYVFADAANSGREAYAKASLLQTKSPTAVKLDAAVSTFDVLIWQSLASVVLPGAAINSVVKAARFAVARSPAAMPAMVSTWMPTVVGLSSIPLIIQPIDHGVDVFMDSTYRRVDFHDMFYLNEE